MHNLAQAQFLWRRTGAHVTHMLLWTSSCKDRLRWPVTLDSTRFLASCVTAPGVKQRASQLPGSTSSPWVVITLLLSTVCIGTGLSRAATVCGVMCNCSCAVRCEERGCRGQRQGAQTGRLGRRQPPSTVSQVPGPAGGPCCCYRPPASLSSLSAVITRMQLVSAGNRLEHRTSSRALQCQKQHVESVYGTML